MWKILSTLGALSAALFVAGSTEEAGLEPLCYILTRTTHERVFRLLEESSPSWSAGWHAVSKVYADFYQGRIPWAFNIYQRDIGEQGCQDATTLPAVWRELEQRIAWGNEQMRAREASRK